MTTLRQATYLGGRGTENAGNILIFDNQVYVIGTTRSNDFPLTENGAQEDFAGREDVFIARLRLDLTRINQATYLGGAERELGGNIAIHDNAVYVRKHRVAYFS